MRGGTRTSTLTTSSCPSTMPPCTSPPSSDSGGPPSLPYKYIVKNTFCDIPVMKSGSERAAASDPGPASHARHDDHNPYWKDVSFGECFANIGTQCNVSLKDQGTQTNSGSRAESASQTCDDNAPSASMVDFGCTAQQEEIFREAEMTRSDSSFRQEGREEQDKHLAQYQGGALPARIRDLEAYVAMKKKCLSDAGAEVPICQFCGAQ